MIWEWIIGSAIVLAVAAGLAGFMWVCCRRIRPQGRKLRIGLSVLTGTLPIVTAVWAATSSYLLISIPREATDVRVKMEPMISILVDDNARFHLPHDAFRRWMEKQCGRPWAAIQDREMRREQEDDFDLGSGLAWMDTSGVTRGYVIDGDKGGMFRGTIVYDLDREMVYYHHFEK